MDSKQHLMLVYFPFFLISVDLIYLSSSVPDLYMSHVSLSFSSLIEEEKLLYSGGRRTTKDFFKLHRIRSSCIRFIQTNANNNDLYYTSPYPNDYIQYDYPRQA